jgi:transcriptional regulator with XRE-family HTH domain
MSDFDTGLGDNLTAFQKMLLDVKLEYMNKMGNPRVSDNKFARYLGVSSSNFNQWILGSRTPSYANALQLSKCPLIGMRVFDVLGYDRPYASNDLQLNFVADNWEVLSKEDKKQIIEHVKEVLSFHDHPNNTAKKGAKST